MYPFTERMAFQLLHSGCRSKQYIMHQYDGENGNYPIKYQIPISRFPHFPKHRNLVAFPHFPQNFPQKKADFSTVLGLACFFRYDCLKSEKTVHTVSKSSFWEGM